MEITVDRNRSCFFVKINSQDTQLQEDLDENVYEQLPNGKINYKNRLGSKVNERFKQQILDLLEEIQVHNGEPNDSLVNYFFNRLHTLEQTNFLIEKASEKYDTIA